MLVCCVVIMVVVAEQVGKIATGKWWQCYVSGAAGLHMVMLMMPTLWKWSHAKYLPEWQGQCKLKARKQRQYRKAKKRERVLDEQYKHGTRRAQRIRRTRLLPVV